MKLKLFTLAEIIIISTLKLSSDNIHITKSNDQQTISNKIKDLESKLFQFDTDITTLKKSIKSYKSDLNKAKIKFSDVCYTMYYICNHIKYGINLSYEVSSVLSMVALNNAILNLCNEQNCTLSKIKKLQEVQKSIIEQSKKLKNNITALQKEYELSAKNENPTKIKKQEQELIFSKISSIDELLHELEAEEYVGFLKTPIAKLQSNKILKFSNPCFGEKRSRGNRVQFITKPASKIFAPESGIVLFFGTIDDEKILVLQHSQKCKTIFFGIANAFVAVGDYVYKNQIIGELYDSVQSKIALEVQVLENGSEVNSSLFFKN